MRRPKRDLPRHGDPEGCPAMDCGGGSSGRQHPVSRGQTSAILDHLSSEAAGALAERLKAASRCSYCGCVYIRSWTPETRTVLGYWDNGVLGPGWRGKE